MTDGLKTIIYPVRDLPAATAVYTRLLGVPPTVDQPYYVGFEVDGQHIGLDPNGHRNGMTGPVGYRHVPEIRPALSGLLEAGAQLRQDVRDVGGGRLIATVTDADGNVVGLSQDA